MSKKSLFKGGVLGVISGVVGGLLFAPKSGKETRRDIKDTAKNANSEVEKQLKELHVELKEKAETAKLKAGELSGKAKEELEGLAKRADFAKDKVGELITAVREFEAEDKEVEKTIKDSNSVVSKIIKATKKDNGKKK